MKIYHVCEYCESIIKVQEIAGLEQAVEIKGVCPDCAQEIGFNGDLLKSHYYH